MMREQMNQLSLEDLVDFYSCSALRALAYRTLYKDGPFPPSLLQGKTGHHIAVARAVELGQSLGHFA